MNSKIIKDLFEFKLDRSADIYYISALNHEGIRSFLTSNNVLKYYSNDVKSMYVRRNGCILEEISIEKIKDLVKAHLFVIETTSFTFRRKKYILTQGDVRNCFLKQSHLIFNDKWLEHLEICNKPMLKDTGDDCFIIFKNVIIRISKNDLVVKTKNIDEFNGSCIWKDNVIQKDYQEAKEYENNPFFTFTKNVTKGVEGRYDSLRSAIGYLIHNYNGLSDGRAVILYDEAITGANKPMGGTGKGLFANAISKVRTVTKIDGKNFKQSNRFKFDLVKPSTQTIWLDETDSDFNFEDLFSNLTDGFTNEQKFKSQSFTKQNLSPKMLICSNKAFSNIGSSNKRRQFIIEFNNHYSSQIVKGTENPIAKELGILFGENWTSNTWNEFYTFLIDCVLFYFKNGLVPYNVKSVNINYLKQKTSDEFVTWSENKDFELNVEYSKDNLFGEYSKIDSECKRRGFTNWLMLYANSKDWNYKNKTSNGKSSITFSN